MNPGVVRLKQVGSGSAEADVGCVVGVGHRLLLLAAAGVLLTAAVVGTALASLAQVGAVNRELTAVSHALTAHKTADEMHDALRADVARAQLVDTQRLSIGPAEIRRETRRHAERFRAALDTLAAVRLPPGLESSVLQLRSIQDTYLQTAQATVDSALSPAGLGPGAQADYETSFQFLVPEQNRLTRRLMATSRAMELAAAEQRATAARTITLAGLLALGGWLALAGWHYRSLHRLQAALLAEGQQRATANLLQTSLLPEQLPTVPGVELAATAIPGISGQHIGGDWYDAFHLPTGQVCLVIGDVVGHGLPAASAMGQLRNMLRAYALLDPSPAAVLAQVNHAAVLLDTCELATCICLILDPNTHTARWASAGHPPPLLARPQQPGRLLAGEPGPPLSVTDSAHYPEHALTLTAGDHLLLYSDGLVESRTRPIDVGMSVLEQLPLPKAEPQAICQHLITAMTHNRSHDDVTCLLIKIHTAAATAPAPLAIRQPLSITPEAVDTTTDPATAIEPGPAVAR